MRSNFGRGGGTKFLSATSCRVAYATTEINGYQIQE
jgi:hypothetical protein